jgi:leader peptidase (prepilin peptidase) / N-methyltransferase
MIWVLGAIIGLCLGSLTKVIADRSLNGKSFWGRSYCEGCKKQIAWYDLFPVISYLILQGKCRHCKMRLSLQYPMIEILVGLVTAAVFAKFLPGNFLEIGPAEQGFAMFGVVFYCVIVVVLFAVFLTDFKTGYIPDRITYPAIWIIFLLLIASSAINTYMLYDSLKNSSIGKYLLPPYSNYFYVHAFDLSKPLFQGALTALGLGLFFYLLILFTRGKGMGGGDLKLGVFMGLAFGFPYALVALMLSFLLGSALGIGLILAGKKRFGQTIPFGPFLSLGGIITIFFGAELLNWYLNFSLFLHN